MTAGAEPGLRKRRAKSWRRGASGRRRRRPDRLKVLYFTNTLAKKLCICANERFAARSL